MSFARRILRSSVEAVGTSVAFVILYSVLAGLAGTPARLEEVAHRSAEGMVPLEYLTSALFRDTNVNLVFFIAFWAVIWLALKTHHWMRGESSRRFLFLLIFPFAVLVAIAGFMGSEFKVERGVYPSWFDLNNAQGGTGVGVGYLKLALRPALLAAWAALAFATLLLSEWMRRRQSTLRTWTALILVIVGAAGFSDQLRYAWMMVSSRLPSILSARVTDSPLAAFVRKKKQATTDSYYGVTALLTGLDATETKRAAEGFALLGLDPRAPARLEDCALRPHPLAESMDRPPLPRSEFGRSLQRALHELSASLFDGTTTPIHIHQILVESFLAADFASLGSKLPAHALPFWNGLISRSSEAGSATVVAKNMRQAGVRTSQALSASFCGLGTLSHQLSMGRDLQSIPLRCLPELMGDAGFVSEMHHGYRPEFDLRTQFFKDRQMDFWHIRRIPLQKSALSSFWDGDFGISDRKLLEFSLTRATRELGSRSTYTGILTLSSHRPFVVPEDMPKADLRVADTITDELPPKVASRPLTRERLRILRYVDGALREYFDGISRLPKTSRSITIAVLYGDHSHSDADLFAGAAGRSPSENLAALSRIPFLIHIFPESLRQHPRRKQVFESVERLNRLLEKEPISQNDLPRMMLALLSRSSPFRSLPTERRWHTLGGQTLSAHARPAEAAPEAVTWGVDGSSRAYFIGKDGAPHLSQLQDPMDGPESIRTSNVFQPISQALTLWLKRSITTCKP